MSDKPPPPREPTLNELNAAVRQPSSPIIYDFTLPASRPTMNSDMLQLTAAAEASSDARSSATVVQSVLSFDEYLETFRRQNVRAANSWWSYTTSLQGIFFPFRPEGMPQRLSHMHVGLSVFVRLPSSRYTNAARYEPGTILRCNADFAEVSVRDELIGATIRQLRHRKTRHRVPFEVSLEADATDAPTPTVLHAQPPLRQYTCSCCNLDLSDVLNLSIFEKSLVLESTDNKLHLVDLSEPAYWGLLNALFHRLPEASVERTISFVSPRLKRTTLDQLAFYLARVPNLTTFVHPRATVDEFTLETCRQQLEAHLKTLRSVANVPKWAHLPTKLIGKGKRFVATTDVDPVTQCVWPYQRIAVNTSAPDDNVTFEIRSSRVLGLLFEVRNTAARFLPRKVTIRAQRFFATDDLEALTDALNEAESVFAFTEEFNLFLIHTPPAIASMNETEGFAVTIAQQLSALEFAVRIWLSSAPLQRHWTTEVHGDLRAHRAIKSQEYPVILQKLGRSLQLPFAIRSLRRTDAVDMTEIRSTLRHIHEQRTCVVSATLSPESAPVPTSTPAATWQDRFRNSLTFNEHDARC